MDQKTTIVKYVKDWRSTHGVTGTAALTAQQATQFARDLQEQVAQFSVRPERAGWATYDKNTPLAWERDAGVIPYSGNAGDVPGWKLAKSMSENASGSLFYISDTPAGKILNDEVFKLAVEKATGGDDLGAGIDFRNAIFSGAKVNGMRSPSAIGDVVSLDDFVSDKLMREVAHGDVRTITADAPDHGVFLQTELKALLDNPRVTAINGVEAQTLRQCYLDTQSLLEVNKIVARASRELLDGTRYTLTQAGANPSDSGVYVAAVANPNFFNGAGVDSPQLRADDGSVKVLATLPPALNVAAAPDALATANTDADATTTTPLAHEAATLSGAVAVLSIENTDTAAFHDLGRHVELSRVLTDAAMQIQDGMQPPFALLDTNGNQVGHYAILSAAPADALAPGAARLHIDLSQPAFQQNRDVQLAHCIMLVAGQVSAPDAAHHLELHAPDSGQLLGALVVSAPAPHQLVQNDLRDDHSLTL